MDRSGEACHGTKSDVNRRGSPYRRLFWFPLARSFVLRGAKITFFFERAIFEKSWSSTTPALRFLAVSRFFVFCFGARPPARFGDLELTGTKKQMLPFMNNRLFLEV